MNDTTDAALDAPAMLVEYTNYRGETARRVIKPMNFWWGKSEWHPEEQWMLTVYDCEKEAQRFFAWQDMRPIANDATSSAITAIRAERDAAREAAIANAEFVDLVVKFRNERDAALAREHAAYARGVQAAKAAALAGIAKYMTEEYEFRVEVYIEDAIRALADAPPAPQCCMCGKKGLSTVEDDGGTECGLDDGRWVCSADCYDRAYPDAPPAPVVGVKPLVWRSVNDKFGKSTEAYCPLVGTYSLRNTDRGYTVIWLNEQPLHPVKHGAYFVYGLEDLAKAAAQADYEARIRAALLPQAKRGE